jgi:hypothetical protein
MSPTLSMSVLAAALFGAADLEEVVRPYEMAATLTPDCEIDRLVLEQLNQQGIQPANLCSDAVFVRRVYLDAIGTLPTAAEARTFIVDRAPGKRAALVDRLLERDEFADYWAMRWSDVLRVKAEFPINLWPNAVQAYHRWIRTSIKENRPYDQFTREMLTASGSNFRVPQVNFYRAMQNREPEAIARSVALSFLGVRADEWPEAKVKGMAVFFAKIGFKPSAEWKEEIVFFDELGTSTKQDSVESCTGTFPDGTSINIAADQDPRQVFADWLIQPKNPWFSRSIANRIWFWLMGRGIVHEADDIRIDNPPCNPALLAWLEEELIKSDYDLKHIIRSILNSRTYQLSSIPRSDLPQSAVQFAYYPVRRLDAEVLIDALCQITGTTEEYSSPIPEPFTFIPEDQRSISLADGSTTSSFLELFGRPSRDTGMAAERNNRPTASQRLHMLNSSHVRSKIEQGPKLRLLLSSSRRNPRETITAVYLTILSRFPTPDELKAVQHYATTADVRGQEALVDVVWALVNSAEFLYQH